MTSACRKRWLIYSLLILSALASRLAVAYFLANDAPGDSHLYTQLARNLLEHQSYSINPDPPYEPTLIRLPGYPLFLAVIFSIAGHGNNTAVRVVQAFVDTATCVLIALLAFAWFPVEEGKRRAALWAFILSVLCPFGAIYTATILTETLTTFFAVASVLIATYALRTGTIQTRISWWVAAGLLSGCGELIRPDYGLFTAGIGITLVLTGLFQSGRFEAEKLRPTFIKRFTRTFIEGAIFSIAFILPLVPWTIRNERVFHLFQPIAPANANMPDEFVPRGYNRWVRTWIDDERYIETALWNLDEKPIQIDQFPAAAFASEDERQRVAALLDRYNHPPDTEETPMDDSSASDEGQSNDEVGKDDTDSSDESADESKTNDTNDHPTAQDETQSVEMTPEVDAGFAQIAQERIARAPVHYYFILPSKRALSLWFDTHSQYYPFEGELFPLSDLDRSIHQQFWLPLFSVLLWAYTLLALLGAWGLWRLRKMGGLSWLCLAALVTLPRLAFMSSLENPEPRYVVELFAFVAAFGGIGIAWVKLSLSARWTKVR